MTTAIKEIKEIDNFKTYEDYKNMYIVDYYIRNEYDDSSIIYSSTDLSDIEDYMDDHDLWEDYIIYEIDKNGLATYPTF